MLFMDQVIQRGPSYEIYLITLSILWAFSQFWLLVHPPMRLKKQTIGTSSFFSCEYLQSASENLHLEMEV